MVSPQFPRQRISPSAGRDGDHEFYTANEKGLILMGRQYIRFDEIEDVISSVELLALVSPLLRKQPSYWKWAIISVHNGMQGAMVCVLGSTSGVGVLSKKSAKAVFAWHEAGGQGPYPEEWMANFTTLLERCRTERPGEEPFKLTAAQERDIKRLNDHFRNNFAHFVPESWSIEKVGLPRIVGTAVECIQQLMNRDEVIYRLSGNRQRRLKSGIKKIRRTLQSLAARDLSDLPTNPSAQDRPAGPPLKK
jgi:hypothetical protein